MILGWFVCNPSDHISSPFYVQFASLMLLSSFRLWFATKLPGSHPRILAEMSYNDAHSGATKTSATWCSSNQKSPMEGRE